MPTTSIDADLVRCGDASADDVVAVAVAVSAAVAIVVDVAAVAVVAEKQ